MHSLCLKEELRLFFLLSLVKCPSIRRKKKEKRKKKKKKERREGRKEPTNKQTNKKQAKNLKFTCSAAHFDNPLSFEY